MKRPELLAPVALTRDLPEFGLAAGHIGAVVEVFEPDVVVVEFLDRNGYTVALLDLNDDDLRPPTKKELAYRSYPDPLPPAADSPIADARRSRE